MDIFISLYQYYYKGIPASELILIINRIIKLHDPIGEFFTNLHPEGKSSSPINPNYRI